MICEGLTDGGPFFDLLTIRIACNIIAHKATQQGGIGYVQGWEFAAGLNYPYFFLNWGSPAGAFGFSSEMPFMGCAWWILALLVFLIIIGYCYLAVADSIGGRIGADANKE